MTTNDKTIPLVDRLRESAQHWVNEIDTRVEAACAIELLQMRIAELEAAQPAIATQWVSVKDRLPKPREAVCLIDIDRWRNTGGDFDMNVHACGYLDWSGHENYWSCFGEGRGLTIDAFTHWAPLPPAPQEQK